MSQRVDPETRDGFAELVDRLIINLCVCVFLVTLSLSYEYFLLIIARECS